MLKNEMDKTNVFFCAVAAVAVAAAAAAVYTNNFNESHLIPIYFIDIEFSFGIFFRSLFCSHFLRRLVFTQCLMIRLFVLRFFSIILIHFISHY